MRRSRTRVSGGVVACVFDDMNTNTAAQTSAAGMIAQLAGALFLWTSSRIFNNFFFQQQSPRSVTDPRGFVVRLLLL